MSLSAAEKTAQQNVRAFTWFRVCFTARFYYPVYTILFLDYGLTLEQFGVLNAVWAATIFLFEVPSGAIADVIGRRRLVVAAAVMMIIEMGVLLIAPIGGGALMFSLFLVNRILSGLAEAAASGADEALTYDSLKAAGQEDRWGRVLERVQRDTSIAFFVAMLAGAAVYDPQMINAVFIFFGLDYGVAASDLVKVPIALTFIVAIFGFFAALRMSEERSREQAAASATVKLGRSWRNILSAGTWIWVTPMAFGVIGASMLIDSLIRLFLTLASEYWLVIDYPVVSFGVIGSSLSLLGIFIPRLARLLSEKSTPMKNLVVTLAVVFVGFLGLSLAIPWWGLIPAILLHVAFLLNNFFASRYLNAEAGSEHRATVLSFRSLANNLLYGGVSLGYSGLIAYLKFANDEQYAGLDSEALKDRVFVAALGWLPWYFLATVAVYFALIWLRFGRRGATATN